MVMADDKVSIGKKRTRPVVSNEEGSLSRRQKLTLAEQNIDYVAGKVKKVKLLNFMCHGLLEFNFGDRINFLSGKNGSGKSAILTALVIGLGGRTSDTNRGHSLKDLIKNGQTSSTIEITLHNVGEFAYNNEVYGNEITVVRKISDKASSYKFLSEKGKIISTKRDELSFISHSLNLQINNPICILNQDVARTFLKSTTPIEFYRLFRKGTLLEHLSDKINNIKEDRMPRLNLMHSKSLKELQENSKDIRKLKQMREKQIELLGNEKDLESVEKELHWSYVLSIEEDIKKEEKIIEEYMQSLETLTLKVQKRDIAVNELKTRQRALEEKLCTIRSENQVNENDFINIESEMMNTKELISKRMNEKKRLETKKANAIKTYEEIETLISKQESHAKELQAKKKELKARKEVLGKKCDELKAVLSTAQVHRQQLADTVDACNDSFSTKMRFTHNLANTIRHKEQYLNSLKQGKDELSVYAPWMPGFVEAIKTAYKKGKFEQRPRGPFGAYMKVIEEDWGPAIESFLGKRAFFSFCVHSRHDFNVLDGIIESLNIPKHQRPSITISKFLPKVHNIERNETRTAQYVSLFRALTVSDVVVANSLIDQWEVEKVLLIPTNAEAYPLMENINKVPANCDKALTKTGDQFFPQPNYRSYSGTVNNQSRFLQVNPEKIIRLTEHELKGKKDEYKNEQQQLQELDKKLKNAQKGLHEAEKEVKKLTTQLANSEIELVQLDQQEVPECFDENVLNDDLKHWKGNLDSCEQSIKEIEGSMETLIKKASQLKKNINEFKEKKKSTNDALSEVQNELTNIKLEQKKVNDNHDYYTNLSKSESRKSDDHVSKLEELKKELTDAIKEATDVCPERIEKPRKIKELQQKQTDLRRMVNALKKVVIDDFIEPADFELRMQAFDNTLRTLQIQGEVIREIEAILEGLPKKLDKLGLRIGCNTDSIFQNILRERHFVGKLDIDHENKRLNIVIKADPKGNCNSPISTLSGGERSFSMVAFIIALWENVASPFYFLDEFDVFMDEVNRKVVMDLLISVAKSRPQHQYVLLTPHSTVAEDSAEINFFRMNDPREV